MLKEKIKEVVEKLEDAAEELQEYLDNGARCISSDILADLSHNVMVLIGQYEMLREMEDED